MIYQHLEDFTGLPRAMIMNMVALGALPIKEEWEEKDPKTPEEIIDFYKKTENYLWDLTSWHISKPQRENDEVLADKIMLMKPGLVLDYGCGIGVLNIALARRGIKSVAVDLPGYTLDFCKYRIDNLNGVRGMVEVVALDKKGKKRLAELYGKFDVVVCLEVLEHLPTEEDVLNLARKLRMWVKKDKGTIMHSISTGTQNGIHPMHLPHNPELEKQVEVIISGGEEPKNERHRTPTDQEGHNTEGEGN